MWHRNAKFTYLSRLDMVRQVEVGWSKNEVARQFRVSRPTVAKYVRRYAEAGLPGLEDRSSKPRNSPRLTPPRLVKAICKLRRKRGWGPHRISWLLKIPRSTCMQYSGALASTAWHGCTGPRERSSATSILAPETGFTWM